MTICSYKQIGNLHIPGIAQNEYKSQLTVVLRCHYGNRVLAAAQYRP